MNKQSDHLRELEKLYKWMVEEEKKIEERIAEGEEAFLRKVLNRASISIKRSMLGEVISALKWNIEWTAESKEDEAIREEVQAEAREEYRKVEGD